MGLLHYIYVRESCKANVIIYLVRTGIPVCDILCADCSIICSILEYACPVWHPGLTKKLLKDIEEMKQESPAVADKPARRLRKVCTVYVRAVGLL